MTRQLSQPPTTRRVAIRVRGVVQGVGFRPFVYNAARARGLAGWVQNQADQVRIEVEGLPDQVDGFIETLRTHCPPQARIDSLESAEIPSQGVGAVGGFDIRPSHDRGTPRPTIPADLATCAECLFEIRSPGERRFGYPFTNCTNCGPRWSIIEGLPYDRARTSMAGFPMCPACRAEYANPADRRFHAQPIACPQCGPQLELVDADGAALFEGQRALSAAVEAVREGRILALKGLGGFQLVVDAGNAEAVNLLRERKRRPHKPFALMLANLEEICRRCEVSEEEASQLQSAQAPILLLRRRGDSEAADDVVEAVAPGNPYLGVMLPYTPLHHVLMSEIGRPVVCTSGNLSEEPMAIDTDEAIERLGEIADLFLVHDRPIVRPVDDSVARVGPAGFQILRRARGYAPLPIDLGFDAPTILAVGGHLKNAVALSLGRQAIVGSHVGDLDNVPSVEVHRRAVQDLVDFFNVEPAAVACDLHPDYASTRLAEHLAAEWDVPVVRVQHHHAHVAACAVEHRLEGPVVGFSWDGTGYGTDGTVWGCEALVCEGGDFSRAAHLRHFSLPGGDQTVREPRRAALAVLYEILGDEAAGHAAEWFEPSQIRVLTKMLARGLNCPRTSSLGRLFDAMAAILGLPAVVTFEGQAAMALEFAADWDVTEAYALPLSSSNPAVADWEPMIRDVVKDREAGVPIGRISARFHNALAEMAVAAAQHSGCSQVVLTGGCFQNALLTARVRARLLEAGFDTYDHHQVPPGDGGIALGQLAVAAKRLKETADVSGSSR